MCNYLIKNSTTCRKTVKNYIIRNELLEYKCDVCKNTHYNSLPIVLELDHIDGDNTNNEITNLRFLCPICHSRTDTYCGKNKKISKLESTDSEIITALNKYGHIGLALKSLNYSAKTGKVVSRAKEIIKNNVSLLTEYLEKQNPIKISNSDYQCSICSIPINKNKTMMCFGCYCLNRKKANNTDVDLSLLKELVKTKSICEIGKIFKMSDNGIRKVLKRNNIDSSSNPFKKHYRKLG